MVRLIKQSAKLAAILLVLFGVLIGGLRPWYLRWGATDSEQVDPLPGDDLGPSDSSTQTRAITIRARPAAIWPWISQLGQDRAGFYSYALLENLCGAGMPTIDHLLGLPERKAGEQWWIAAPERFGGTGYAEVAKVEPDHALVLVTHEGLDPAPIGTWTFALLPQGDGTRFLARGRIWPIGQPRTLRQTALFMGVYEPARFVMERQMMVGLRDLAEGHPRPAWQDFAEQASWIVVLGVVLAAAVGSLVRQQSTLPFAVYAAAGSALLMLPILAPPLAVTLCIALVLTAACAWALWKRNSLR